MRASRNKYKLQQPEKFFKTAAITFSCDKSCLYTQKNQRAQTPFNFSKKTPAYRNDLGILEMIPC